MTSFEKVCITRNTKDRVFINIISWVLINIYLVKKFFLWHGEEKQSPAELHEAIAMALIENQYYSEHGRVEPVSESISSSDAEENDPAYCVKHPNYKKNKCRYCYKKSTIFICSKCSVPKRPTARKEKGPKGGEKFTHGGYMHFCKHSGCYAKHNCGHVPFRRTKAQMGRAAAI